MNEREEWRVTVARVNGSLPKVLRRTTLELLCVDAGCVAVGRADELDQDLLHEWGFDPVVLRELGVVVCPSGLGDGSYPLNELELDEGTGYEVVFLCSGPEGDTPYGGYVVGKAFEEKTVEIGRVFIAHELGAGDPCYGEPSYIAQTRPGIYAAFACFVDLEDWGRRVSRLVLVPSCFEEDE